MDGILKHIHSTEDIKNLNEKELKQLCRELRRFLLQKVSKTGGHLASNLGIVELTVALEYCFHLPEDKIVWDVGHQAYIHKMLTGRKEDFDHLRQLASPSRRKATAMPLRQDTAPLPFQRRSGLRRQEI